MNTSAAMAAKEPLLSLIFGTILVVLITLPYFWGLGKSFAQQQENPDSGILKFVALPFAIHFVFVLGAMIFTNVWNLMYDTLQSTQLINTFWSATAAGATNAWVAAAYNAADSISLVLYYLLIAVPLINGVAVWLLSDRVLPRLNQDKMDTLKYGVVKLLGIVVVAGLLTIFYQKTLDVVMFDGHSINFKEWGSASSSTEMQANFYKKIATMAATGVVSIGNRGTASASPSTTTGGTSLMDSYFNN